MYTLRIIWVREAAGLGTEGPVVEFGGWLEEGLVAELC